MDLSASGIIMAVVVGIIFTIIVVKSNTMDYIMLTFKDLADKNTEGKNWSRHLLFFGSLGIVAHIVPYFFNVWNGVLWFWQGIIHLFLGFALGYGAEWLQGMIGWNKGIQGKKDTIESGKDAVVSWFSYTFFAWVAIITIEFFN